MSVGFYRPCQLSNLNNEIQGPWNKQHTPQINTLISTENLAADMCRLSQHTETTCESNSRMTRLQFIQYLKYRWNVGISFLRWENFKKSYCKRKQDMPKSNKFFPCLLECKMSRCVYWNVLRWFGVCCCYENKIVQLAKWVICQSVCRTNAVGKKTALRTVATATEKSKNEKR